jgi:phenylacetate-coenzyme A ligase PaaK-like adenylate-forming protein
MSKFNRAFSDEDLQRECWEPDKWIVSDEVKRAYAHIDDLERKLEEKDENIYAFIKENNELMKQLAERDALIAEAIPFVMDCGYNEETGKIHSSSKAWLAKVRGV